MPAPARASWDPARYLQYGGERLRPALDLLAQIRAERPDFVVDLGCGPGNVTRILQERWPEAALLGVDASGPMLERARENAPGVRFEAGDFATWSPSRPVDVLYSNAALHWVGEHATLFPRLLGTLAPGGFLAVQMPDMHDQPLRRLQLEIAAKGPWAGTLKDAGAAPGILAAEEYWDLLRPHARSVDLWRTTYLHALQGENAVVQWAMGSSLRPFLDLLPRDHHAAFLEAYDDALTPHYPRRPDGTTLLPFQRVFLIAQR